MKTPINIDDEDDEYYQVIRGVAPQPQPVNLTKSESIEEVKILANRMAQIEFSLKDIRS